MDRPKKKAKLAANPATPPTPCPVPKLTHQANPPLPNTTNNPQGLVPLPVSQPVNRQLTFGINQQRVPVNRFLFANHPRVLNPPPVANQPPVLSQLAPVNRGLALGNNQQRAPVNRRLFSNPRPYVKDPNEPTRLEERLQRIGIIQPPPGQHDEWSSPERIPARGNISAPLLGVPRPATPPSPTPKSRSEGPASASRRRYPNGTYFDEHGPNPALVSDSRWLEERGYKNQYFFNKRSSINVNTRGDWEDGVKAMKDMRAMEEDLWKEGNGRYAANAHWDMVMGLK